MSGMVYRWKPHTNFDVDAQRAGEWLEQLRVRQNGQLSPRAVVEDARSAMSVLHKLFEWSDAAAAEAYRQEQARYVLRSITVEVAAPRQEPRPVRAFVSVSSEEGRGYTSVAEVLGDADMRRQMLARAWKELREWQAKWQDYAELADAVAAIEAALETEGDVR